MTNHNQEPLFTTLPRGTLAEQVTEQLEKLIIAKQLQAGEKIPSERELAKQFGVSRTVIREAVRALQARSMLEVNSGSGTVVRNVTTQSVSKSFSMLLRRGGPHVDYAKVSEVRRLLEVEIAGLAAERRTASDIDKLHAIVHTMDEMQRDRDSFARIDVAFHVALAEATHNDLFVVLLESLADIMLEVRRTGFDAPGASSHAIEYHRRIYEQVRDGRIVEAQQIMSEHLDMSEKIFLTGLARQLENSKQTG